MIFLEIAGYSLYETISILMVDEVEPFPPGRGKTWDKGSPEYAARLEYINARIERYFEKFQGSIDYDFTRASPAIEKLQSALIVQTEDYARGSADVSAVQITANALREAFKRKELLTKPPDPEKRKRDNRRYFAEQRREEKFTDGYPTRVHYEIAQEMKKHYIGQRQKPKRGMMCYQLFPRRGWDKDGNEIDGREAERLIREEVFEKFRDRIFVFTKVTYTKSKKNYTGSQNAGGEGLVNPPTSPPVPSAKGKSLDDLKREESERKQRERLDKVQRRGKRS